MGDITGANSIVFLTIDNVFPSPIQLQGFAADDVFDTQPLASVETLMGVDGILSGGFVFVPVLQAFALQADSPSNQLFDQWWAANQIARGSFIANGVVILPNVGTKWALAGGHLTQYQPIPVVKKLLQPRRHSITWNSITAATP